MTFKQLFTAITIGAALVAARAAETPKVGDKAPGFEARDQDGKAVKLSDFAGKQAVLLYFYPKDNTPGCTKEACGFRDRIDDLKKQGVAVLGRQPRRRGESQEVHRAAQPHVPAVGGHRWQGD